MGSLEWCSLRTAPVYPFHTLVRIASVDRERSVYSKRRAIRSAFPWPLEGHTVRILPRLRAVIVIPNTPPADIVGAAIPAITIDRLMRRRERVFPNRCRRRTAIVETAYGFDRYDISPSGLIRCISNVTPPSDNDRWCLPPGRRRERVIPRQSAKKQPFRGGDRIAVASAAIAVAIVAAPGPDSTPTTETATVGAPVVAVASSRQEVQPETFLVEAFPEGRISRVVREGDRVSVRITAPITDGYIPPVYPSSYPPSMEEFAVIRSDREATVTATWRIE